MRYVIVAEKPSVARRIREAINADNVVVTSVRGHVLDSGFPEGYGWRECRPGDLFKVREFRDEVRDHRSLRELKKVFSGAGVLVIATDNDSEGELIGAEILKIWRRVNGNRPYRRMRFNSTDYRELRRAWRNLEETLNWRWVSKALFRQRFDLIAGAAFTRLLTLTARRYDRNVKLISWGPCQSPTLWFIVRRERERLNFKPKPFWTIKAVLESDKGERFEAESDRIWDKGRAEEIYAKASRAGEAVVKSFKESIKNISRPTPLRTDDLLRDMARLTGLSAAKILQVAEDLYAEGYISYPRTETNRYRHGFDYNQPLKAACKGLGVNVEGDPKPRQGRLDDGAHTPIYPIRPFTGGGIARGLWEYVTRRFLANAFYPDARRVERRAEIRIGELTLRSHGAQTVKAGFYEIYPYFRPRNDPIPSLRVGEKLRIVSIRLHEGKTKPPNRLTEAELLKLMEENGIGTDATRATYPKLIIDRGYAAKERKTFKPTELGMRLIELLEDVDERLVTPETRRRVEELMEEIEAGKIGYEEALEKAVSEYLPLYQKLEDRFRTSKSLRVSVLLGSDP